LTTFSEGLFCLSYRRNSIQYYYYCCCCYFTIYCTTWSWCCIA